jgi:hypothetical protein
LTEPKYTHSEETLRLQNIASDAVEKYLRACENRRLELGIIDPIRDEDEYVSNDYFCSAVTYVAEFRNPNDTDSESILLYGRSQGTTWSHSLGMVFEGIVKR